MNRVEIIDNLKIISRNNKKICIKKNNNYSIIDKYKYLKSKNFLNLVDTNIINGYEIRDYIDEIFISKEDKVNELIYLISMLHTKTTHYRTISLNDIKEFYEKETDEIIKIKDYYNRLCEENDYFLFLSPSINLLIDNISLILNALDHSKFFLDKWYEIVKEKKRKRVVFNHNNLKISNFIAGNNVLINFDKSVIDSPIYDLVSLFKNNIHGIDLIDLFDIYLSKYKLCDEELYLLFYKLLKIDIISFDDVDLVNTRNVYELLYYLKKINTFLEYNLKS